ncbi:hypothetical protein PQR63_02860 [Herbaspirillum rhizosphaerae]|uniref:Uncharacterized protein n=1 Tax=Herbaspirillum rhizosphaerae TaxID=346179 RepID=A0ABW8Z333_9BURK
MKMVLFIIHIKIGIVVQKEAFALPFFMAARKAKWAWAWRPGALSIKSLQVIVLMQDFFKKMAVDFGFFSATLEKAGWLK